MAHMLSDDDVRLLRRDDAQARGYLCDASRAALWRRRLCCRRRRSPRVAVGGGCRWAVAAAASEPQDLLHHFFAGVQHRRGRWWRRPGRNIACCSPPLFGFRVYVFVCILACKNRQSVSSPSVKERSLYMHCVSGGLSYFLTPFRLFALKPWLLPLVPPCLDRAKLVRSELYPRGVLKGHTYTNVHLLHQYCAVPLFLTINMQYACRPSIMYLP